MIELTRTGPGVADHASLLTDPTGRGYLSVQGEVSGTASFRILGRMLPSLPWQEIKAASSASFLGVVPWAAHLRLEVVSGTGAVSLYFAKKGALPQHLAVSGT